MGSDVRKTEFHEQHQKLMERLTLLAGDSTLDMEQQELVKAWRERLDTAHKRLTANLSAAFFAQVGRGKSTLISVATGLRLPASGGPKTWSVLPIGDGRTTLGETRVNFCERDDIILDVTPIPADELRKELHLFARDLWSAVGKDEQHKHSAAGFAGQAGEELYGLLRTWLVPEVSKDEADEDPREVLNRLAHSVADADALEEALLSRLDFAERSKPWQRQFANDEDGLTELRATLFALMRGNLPGAPAPQLVQLDVPMSDLGREVAEIIDTRGIDGDVADSEILIAGRSDLYRRIMDPDTMLILCSEFESAPDPMTRSFLKVLEQRQPYMVARMDEQSLRIVIVDRRDAPDDGLGAKQHERDRRDRIAQCRDQLRRAELALELPDEAITAIDARSDSDAQMLRQMLIDMARKVRQHRQDAWQSVFDDAEAAIASLQDREFAAKTRECDLRLWWAWDAAVAQAKIECTDGLAILANLIRDRVHMRHWSHLNAAIRRRGRYYKLDLVSLGAWGAAKAISPPYLQASADVADVIDDAMQRYKDEADVQKHLGLRRIQFNLASAAYHQAIEQSWHKVLSEYFVSQQSDDLWRWCEQRWGQGTGYIADIADRFREESQRAALQRRGSLQPRPPSDYLPMRPALLKLRRVELRNYRGVKHQSLPIGDTTVLVGDNGLGKTCWLEAVAAGIGALLPGIGAGPTPALSEHDVRYVIRELGDVPDRQHQLPMRIEVEAALQGRVLTWGRRIDTLPTETAAPADDALQILARQIGEDVRAHATRQLPVLAYYGTQRLWPPELAPDTGRREVGSRLDGYRDCLQAASTHRHMLEWVRHFTMVELQRKQEIGPLRAIKHAVVSCVAEAEHFGYDLAHEELQLTMRDKQVYSFRMLSDGYRNMVAMVADIAWRASVLNPQLGTQAPTLAEGVVLIDEIDLHLHPKWQRRVLPDLRRVFPRLQFITTTHSPFIIQSLRAGQLVNLDPEAQDAPYADESPEDIAERIMGVEVPQRSERRRRASEVAEQYYTLLEQLPDANPTKLAQLKAELDELLEPYAENQAFAAFLARKRALAEAKRS